MIKIGKSNKKLHFAKKSKKDDFYTRLEDIENELSHYKAHFKDAVICCPCDESEHTNFFKHFMLNIEEYGWKKLICIGYRENRPAEVHIVENRGDGEFEENLVLISNGDFRDESTQRFIDECDIVATNPPFSLFREFVSLLYEKQKKFVILGNNYVIGYKEIFPLIKENKLWTGYGFNKTLKFAVKGDYKYTEIVNGVKLCSVPAITWFTNLEIKKKEVFFDTGIPYAYGMKRGFYKKYDNSDAIDISKTSQIPMDYDGVMGVPLTFLDKYNPNQFEIVGFRKGDDGKDLRVDGKDVFSRILIKKIQK